MGRERQRVGEVLHLLDRRYQTKLPLRLPNAQSTSFSEYADYALFIKWEYGGDRLGVSLPQNRQHVAIAGLFNCNGNAQRSSFSSVRGLRTSSHDLKMTRSPNALIEL